MVTVLFFAQAREATGVSSVELPATTLSELLVTAQERYGPRFRDVLASSRVWVNGETAEHPHLVLGPADEVAVVPPVAGG